MLKLHQNKFLFLKSLRSQEDFFLLSYLVQTMVLLTICVLPPISQVFVTFNNMNTVRLEIWVLIYHITRLWLVISRFFKHSWSGKSNTHISPSQYSLTTFKSLFMSPSGAMVHTLNFISKGTWFETTSQFILFLLLLVTKNKGSTIKITWQKRLFKDKN